MNFREWIVEVDRLFVERHWIDHVMAGFSTDEMRRDWESGEPAKDWVERIGVKHDLERRDEYERQNLGW